MKVPADVYFDVFTEENLGIKLHVICQSNFTFSRHCSIRTWLQYVNNATQETQT